MSVGPSFVKGRNEIHEMAVNIKIVTNLKDPLISFYCPFSSTPTYLLCIIRVQV